MTHLDILQLAAMAGALALGLSLLAFWIWMLFDCLVNERKEGSDRLVWVLAIVLTKLVGAALYYFLRYRRRLAV